MGCGSQTGECGGLEAQRATAEQQTRSLHVLHATGRGFVGFRTGALGHERFDAPAWASHGFGHVAQWLDAHHQQRPLVGTGLAAPCKAQRECEQRTYAKKGEGET